MSARLTGRHILLGVTGSIAAYKAVELLRLLVAEGADVQVLMTHSAMAFVGPLTFATLSGHAVLRDPLELRGDAKIAHIAAGEAADAIVVAPATAHWLAAMAHGLAGDVITATCLAASVPVVIAPAMDGDMYAHPATRENVARLAGFGYAIVEPVEGLLASGASGRGRLAEPRLIVDAAVAAVARAGAAPAGEAEGARGAGSPDAGSPGARGNGLPGGRADFAGRHVVVSAGGTAEPIDPVRFIGNRSSGRMGVAVAEAAIARGARVTLVAGQMSVAAPAGATVLEAPTAAAMRTAILGALPGADVLVMAAAVSDFRPQAAARHKLERGAGLTIELEPTEDILAEVAALVHGRADDGRARQGAPAAPRGTEPPPGPTGPASKPAALSTRPILVGFAAETGSLRRAAEKAARKGVDLLVANDVLEPGAGFAVDTNRVTLIVPGRDPEPWPLLSKREVADRLLDRVATLLLAPPAAGAARGKGAQSARAHTEDRA